MNYKILILKKLESFIKISKINKHKIDYINNFKISMINSIDFIYILFLDKICYKNINKGNFISKFNIAYIILDNNLDADNSTLQNDDKILAIRNSYISAVEFDFLINKAKYNFYKSDSITSKEELDLANLRLNDIYKDQEIFTTIGKLLTKAEKDQNELLRTILFLSRKITGADGGTIYLLEENEKNKKFLRFKYSFTFSKSISYEEFLIPLNKKSIAGYVASTGEIINIDNIYKMPKKKFHSIKHNQSFDKKHNYISKSILTVPMKNHLDNIIGVIQLINCKENFNASNNASLYEAFNIKLETKKDFENKVFPFDSRYEPIMLSVSAQAAIALENLLMIKQIQSQLDEFVKASITAIEDRDPSTSGHSLRVSKMCIELAKAINNKKNGQLKNVKFNKYEMKEIEYASLLHDFGKVSLDFNVFLKEKKLFPKDYSFLILKLDYLYQYLKSKHLEKILITDNKILKSKKNKLINQIYQTPYWLKKIEEIRKSIEILNEPQIQEKENKNLLSKIIKEIKKIDCYDPYGNKIEVISEYEKINLSILKGSLNPKEKKQIESHVEQSYKFVKQIPWPNELKNIPEIIYKHHEKLDGTGYPQKLKGKENIPIQSRIITICDMYDALAASDRPYKKAIPHEKIINILTKEANENKIDKDVLEVFIKNKIFTKHKSNLNYKLKTVV